MGKDLTINGKLIDNVPNHIKIYINGEYTIDDMKDLCNSLIDVDISGIKLAGLILIHSSEELYETTKYVHMLRYQEKGGVYFEDFYDFQCMGEYDKNLKKYQIENLYNEKKDKWQKEFEDYVSNQDDEEPCVYLKYC